MRNISLTEKLIVSFLLFGIISIASVSYYIYWNSKNALTQRTFEQLNSVRTTKLKQIEAFFRDRFRDLNYISNSEDFIKVKDLIHSSSASQNRDLALNEEYQRYLYRYLNSGGYYTRLYYISGNTYLDISIHDSLTESSVLTNKLHANPALKYFSEEIKSKDGLLVQDYDKSKPFVQNLMLGMPLKQRPGEMIVLELSTQAINTIMYENNPSSGLGKTGESYLVGSDFYMRSNSRFQSNAIMNIRVKTSSVLSVFNSEEGTNIIQDYRGIDVFSSYSRLKIPGLNWAIVAEIDVAEAMIPVYRIRNNTMFITVLISTIFFFFVYFRSRHITRPLINLKNAVSKVGEGNYKLTVNVETSDEIGDLSRAFNEMTKRLEEQSDDLKNERYLRLRSAIDGQEAERQRLSRELHDGLGQQLIGIKLRLEGLLYSKPEQFESKTQDIISLTNTTVDEVRRICNNLMPAVLNEFGLEKAILRLLSEIKEKGGINLEFNVGSLPIRMGRKTKVYFYRVIQEIMSNAMKHSKSTLIQVNIESVENYIILKYLDNGVGFDLKKKNELCGNGIRNMRERVNLLGGEFRLQSEPEKGCSIIVKVPFSQREEVDNNDI